MQHKVQLQPLPLPTLSQSKWNRVKSWFKYSESIALARFFVFLGFIIGVVGVLDWTSLIGSVTTGATDKQLMILGSFMAFQGISFEVARRRRETDANFNR